jgi:hypothetical protein
LNAIISLSFGNIKERSRVLHAKGWRPHVIFLTLIALILETLLPE